MAVIWKIAGAAGPSPGRGQVRRGERRERRRRGERHVRRDRRGPAGAEQQPGAANEQRPADAEQHESLDDVAQPIRAVGARGGVLRGRVHHLRRQRGRVSRGQRVRRRRRRRRRRSKPGLEQPQLGKVRGAAVNETLSKFTRYVSHDLIGLT